MASSNNIHFGDQMITIWVGPLAEKEKFTIHKDALSSRASRLLSILDSLSSQEIKPAFIDRAYLLDEQLETFRIFLKWLYAAYIGVTFSVLPSSNLALFQLYAFSYKYCVNFLEDSIVSDIYEKFANDDTLLLNLGSDKPALEAMIKEVPPDTHLYRLVVRSVAYSMRLRTVTGHNWSGSEHNCSGPERAWPEPEDERDLSAFPSRPSTEDEVEEVLNSIPSELWAPISRENLLALTLHAWSQGFVSTVGRESDFLRRFENHGGSGLSES